MSKIISPDDLRFIQAVSSNKDYTLGVAALLEMHPIDFDVLATFCHAETDVYDLEKVIIDSRPGKIKSTACYCWLKKLNFKKRNIWDLIKMLHSADLNQVKEMETIVFEMKHDTPSERDVAKDKLEELFRIPKEACA